MTSCAMAFLYPQCIHHASLLTAVVWVSARSSKCYEENYVPGCTMPVVADHADLYPVYNNITGRTESGLASELVVTATQGQLPQDASTLFINASMGKYRIITPNITVVGATDTTTVAKLEVAAANVKIKNLVIQNLTFEKGINFGAVELVDVAVEASVSFVPTPRQHVVNLDGARFDNITGGSIALFRHVGTVTCAGEFTTCFVLPKNDPGQDPGIVHATGGARVVNISALTSIYGNPYLVSFFAFNKEQETIEATNLARALVLPAIVAVLSVYLAHGSPKSPSAPPK